MPTTTAALGLVITAVIIWYLAEWRHCEEKRQPMNLVRNPLGLLWLAIQRLWRNRRFVGILLFCWLASVGIYRFIIDPLVFAPLRERWEATTTLPTPGQSISQLSAMSTKTVIIDRGGLAGEGPRYWMWRALPQFRQLSVALTRGGGGIIDILALGVLAGVLLTLWFRRPEWLPAHVRQRLAWPTYLTLGAFLVIGAHTGFGFATALGPDPLDFSVSPASQVLYLLLPLFFMFATAVLAAFLWHIVLQIGEGGYWNLHKAIGGTANNWLPIAWLMVLLYLPYTIGPLAMVLTPWSWLIDICMKASALIMVLPIALLFVPWIILAEGASLLPAIKRTFQLIGRRWWDLLVFLPRYLLIVIPVYALFGALGWPTIRNPAILTSLSLARSLVELVLLVVIVVLYQQLAKTEPRLLEDMYPTLHGLWKTLWRVWKRVEHPAG